MSSSKLKEKSSLCELEESGYLREHFEEYRKLVQKGKYICRRCGRVARKERNLCKPENLS